MTDIARAPHDARRLVPSLFALPLVHPRATHYTLLGIAPEATTAEIRAAAARHVARLKLSGASDEAIAEAHGLNLESNEARAAYDAQHPPLSLMRLESTWDPVFNDRATCLAALRRELEAFLRNNGESVHHPDDTTRTDFTSDFTPTLLLDTQEPN